MPLFVVGTRIIYTTAGIGTAMRYNKTEATRIGQLGQDIVVERLRNLGLDVYGTHHNHPFDVLCKGHDDNPVAGIEVKWLGPGVPGTRISGLSIQRKREWAAQNGLQKIFTVIVIEGETLGWIEGIVNGHVLVFDYDIGAFAHKLTEVGVRRIQDQRYGGQ